MTANAKKVDDGGPACPNPELGRSHFGDPGAYPGISIRDWLAGQAIGPVCAQMDKNLETDGVRFSLLDPEDCVMAADACYTLADAMLAARKPGGAAHV